MIASLFKFAAKSAIAFVGIIFTMVLAIVVLVAGLVQLFQTLIG